MSKFLNGPALLMSLALAAGATLAAASDDVVVTSQAFSSIAALGAPPLEARLARVVKDDRCPQHVLCAWAGPVVIEVDVRSAGAAARLTLSSKHGDAAHFLGWSLELQNLEPRPLEPEDFQKLRPLDLYRAALRASRP